MDMTAPRLWWPLDELEQVAGLASRRIALNAGLLCQPPDVTGGRRGEVNCTPPGTGRTSGFWFSVATCCDVLLAPLKSRARCPLDYGLTGGLRFACFFFGVAHPATSAKSSVVGL